MDFTRQLESHVGGLIRLTELYWYDERGRDGIPGRICLVLDASLDVPEIFRLDGFTAPGEAWPSAGQGIGNAALLLLIDGRPKWIWVGQEDVEIL